MKKRLFAFLLCLCLTAELLPAAWADDAPTPDAVSLRTAVLTYDRTAEQEAVTMELTRAQRAYQLWSAASCPEPTVTENPFLDISDAQYYYKAVLWAAESGAMTGTSETAFSPDAMLTVSLEKDVNYTLAVTAYVYEGVTDGVTVTVTGIGMYTDSCTHIFHDNHTPSNWIVVKQATQAETGLRQKQCTQCGEVLSEESIHRTGTVTSVIPITMTTLAYDRTTEQTTLSGQASRGWLVYQLWSEHGAPEPSSSAAVTAVQFADVAESDYYYKAVLWAVQNGITAGTDSAHFSPNAQCIRAQLVTFLYRAAGKPAVSADTIPYTDVANTSYYYAPVQWAYQSGILRSTAETDSPLAKAVRDGVEETVFHPSDTVSFTLQEDIDYSTTITPYVYHGTTDGVTVTVLGIGEYAGTMTHIFHDNHTAAAEWTMEAAVTCTTDGLRQKHCTQCGDVVEQEIIPATGHKIAVRKGFAAGCTSAGLTDGTYCSVCYRTLTGQEIIPAKGHSFTNYVYNNDARPAVDGTETASCNHGCGKTETRSKAGTALPLAPEQAAEAFSDVDVNSYYALPIAWAVAKNVTKGTGDGTTFSPDAPCTRAQIVTFLWRAKGSPEPTGEISPFVDVADIHAYYYKAVLWAVEQNITTGSGENTFSPEDICTRAQAVTFLWRAAGSPQTGGTNPFADVTSDSWYAAAVQWTVQHSITNGISAAVFDPPGICSRGQIVTFLHRDMG